MLLSLIAVADENNVIGKDNAVPWSLPDDLAYFHETTRGHPVIMGRKTHECIGRPLSDRLNIVLSRNMDLRIDGCLVLHSLHDAIGMAQRSGCDEAFVIGGGEVYGAALSIADRLYMTRVHSHLGTGDTFFPPIPFEEWKETSRKKHPADAKHLYPLSFIIYDRVR